MSEMKSTSIPSLRACCAFAVIGAALALSGCDKGDNRTAGEKVDAAIAKTERAADKAAAKTGEAVNEAKEKMATSDAGAKMSQATKDAGSAIASAADDATITAAVNAGLAKDPDLSAIKIDVDTQAGKVTLRGPAPTPTAKERAEQIAKGVQGVSSVDNQLEVKAM